MLHQYGSSRLKNEEQFEELNGPRRMTYACRLGLKRQKESVKNFIVQSHHVYIYWAQEKLCIVRSEKMILYAFTLEMDEFL